MDVVVKKEEGGELKISPLYARYIRGKGLSEKGEYTFFYEKTTFLPES